MPYNAILYFLVFALLFVDLTSGRQIIDKLLQILGPNKVASQEKTNCYPKEDLGCFPPWFDVSCPFPPPMPPDQVDVQIYCYTRESTERHTVQLRPQISLLSCPFISDRRTVFITHGFISSGNATWLSVMKDNYLIGMDANVFLVDWGKGAEHVNYFQVASNTRMVGAEIARFLRYLQGQQGLSLDYVHLIGHSLGVYCVAYAAKAIPNIYRLTALDAAQPCFEGQPKEVRLDVSDAKFVEVVHTNGVSFIPNLGFGEIKPRGHVDFYINGGQYQPGCDLSTTVSDKGSSIKSIADLANFPVETLKSLVSCSHTRAYEYYTQVVRGNCTIWGRKANITNFTVINDKTLIIQQPLTSNITRCDAESCIPLNLNTPMYKARGIFAANTTKEPPYCETNSETNRRLMKQIQSNTTSTKEAKLQCVPKKNVKDLLFFRLAVAESLLDCPTGLEEVHVEVTEAVAPKNQNWRAPLPGEDGLGGFNHWPVNDALTTARACRYSNCTSRTRIRLPSNAAQSCASSNRQKEPRPCLQ